MAEIRIGSSTKEDASFRVGGNEHKIPSKKVASFTVPAQDGILVTTDHATGEETETNIKFVHKPPSVVFEGGFVGDQKVRVPIRDNGRHENPNERYTGKVSFTNGSTVEVSVPEVHVWERTAARAVVARNGRNALLPR